MDSHCKRYRDSIQELVDGTLGRIRRAELESHLDQCDDCRALAADLQRIRDVAESLDHPAPPDHVWLHVAGRLRQEGRVKTAAPVRITAPSRFAVLAIAAALVILVGASFLVLAPRFRTSDTATVPDTASQARQGNAATDDTVQTVESEFRLAEQHLQNGIAKLQEAARSGESTIDPQTAETLQKNLTVIDQAIAESR